MIITIIVSYERMKMISILVKVLYHKYWYEHLQIININNDDNIYQHDHEFIGSLFTLILPFSSNEAEPL